VTSDRTPEYLASLVRELSKVPGETEWVEFKVDDAEPESVGEYISALANSAALLGKVCGHLVWGVRNDDNAIVGTKFKPRLAKVGNEELENWLLRLLEPKIDFRFFEVVVEGAPSCSRSGARSATRFGSRAPSSSGSGRTRSG
jgi:predicted HTH transcriptional regulator